MRKVVILGGGIAGLLSAYVLSKHRDLQIALLEPETLGGELLSGGLRYIHNNAAMRGLLDELRLIHSDYMVKGSILLRDKLLPYPQAITKLPSDQSERIQIDYYRKTRRAEPGKNFKKSMDDPAANKPKSALRVPLDELVENLARRSRAKIIKARATAVSDMFVFTSTHQALPYDYLITTIPLWEIRRICPWDIPEGMAIKLNAIYVSPIEDKYGKWDYVYTPYTPANAIHRISPQESGYSVEVNGKLDGRALLEDLNFLFRRGFFVREIREGLKGHLLPLEYEAQWPENVFSLGRFSQWDSRITADMVYKSVLKLSSAL